MTFYGNKKSQDILDKAAEGGFSHVYLLYGPSHLGKRALAEKFAAKILGVEFENIQDECGADVFIIDGEDDLCGIESIRRMRKNIALSPRKLKKKAILAFDIDKLKQESLNAFLKSLEEPPADTVFILTASSAVLKTIESRSFIINFFPLSCKEMEKMPSFGLSAKEKNFFFFLGKPGILLDSCGDKIQSFPKLSEILEMDINGRFNFIEKIIKDMEQIENLMYNWIGEARRLFKDENYDRKNAAILKELLDAFELISEKGANARLILENLLLKI